MKEVATDLLNVQAENNLSLEEGQVVKVSETLNEIVGKLKAFRDYVSILND